jgi:hypothetical protein
MKRKLLLTFILFLHTRYFAAVTDMDIDTNKPEILAFVADTQAPMWIEGVFLRKDNNPQATKNVMLDLIKLRPTALFMLGDVVSLGLSNRAWITIDYFLKEFVNLKIPVYGILGNHELMQRPFRGEKNFQKFFPEHVRTGYYRVVDSIAVLLMNSNITSLSPAENKKQAEWYSQTLQELDDDHAITAIIVTCHHSPFTNSRLVSPSNFAQQTFIPPFIKSKKAKLFLSGHAHLFEHFKYKDKDFLVIGGGGGLRHPIGRKGVRCPDLSTTYKPAFHYLTVKREHGEMVVTSHALEKDFSGFHEGFTMKIPLETVMKND